MREFVLLLAMSFGGAVAYNPQSGTTPDPYPAHWVGSGAGDTTVLYRKHNIEAMDQGNAPSCVATAYAKALETMHGHKFSAEWLYGRTRAKFDFTTYPGAWVSWGGETIRDVGAVPARDYSVLGHNLTEYSQDLANHWHTGPPARYDWVAAQYRSTGYFKVQTFNQLRDSLANGVPVVIGSTVGFGSYTGQVRTRDGLLHSKWWSRWPHAMVVIGVSDGNSKRALILNSWGKDWVTGPKWIGDEPDGSFWVDLHDINKILRQGDSYAVLPILGMPL